MKDNNMKNYRGKSGYKKKTNEETANQIEKVLLNRFDMSQWKTGFVDNASHMCVAASKNIMELKELSPRGLVEWRTPMTESFCCVNIQQKGKGDRKHPIYISKVEYLPWTVRHTGFYQTDTNQEILIYAVMFSPAINQIIWNLEIETLGEVESEYIFSLNGFLTESKKKHMIKKCDGGIICSFNPETKTSKYLSFPEQDGIQPIWSIRSSMVEDTIINKSTGEYSLQLKTIKLKQEQKTNITIQIDYDTTKVDVIDTWAPSLMYQFNDINCEVKLRKKYWVNLLESALNEPGDIVKKLRSSAGLVRCGCKWKTNEDKESIFAEYCSVTSWSSTTFFWDAIIAATGLMQFNIKLAEDTIKSLYLKQREDGCVPTHSYEHVAGSTFYPQAPITGWALVHMLDFGASPKFIQEITVRIDKLFQWFMYTQDHDGDGLPEWRFTGCTADNSPLFDHYARPTNVDLSDFWNIYLPPIASVSLSSYLIMEAKCIAYLYKHLGENGKSVYYSKIARQLGEKLKKICMEDGKIFFDYDHHTGCFNRALTLYSFLPLWAGVEIDKKEKEELFEKYLLNPEIFFGEYPFPYLAYDEEAYKPDGYWRGRVWPHITLWILEALWENGYEKQADEAADRLLRMMDQQEEILENYYSNPEVRGGGDPDFAWSLGTYLMLENRIYRYPVHDVVNS